ncbi:MAG: glycosyltransferase family 87 protein [Planctomycetota bacterium]
MESSENEGEESAKSFPRLEWIGLSVPFLLALALLAFSPNFQHQSDPRNEPFGGDFLQDWIGGYLVRTAPQKLYDPTEFKAAQHDFELVGFQWPESKYFPPVYPPFFYLAMLPFSMLPLVLAAKIWLFLSAAFFSTSALLLICEYWESRHRVALGLWACLIFTPLIRCLSMSHKSTLLLLILTGTFLLLKNRRPWLAGLVFGIIAFKPHLGIVIGLSMLLKKQWAFAAGSLTMVAALVGGSYLMQPEWWPAYLDQISEMGDYVQSGGYQLAESHSIWGAMQLSLGRLGPVYVTTATLLMSGLVIGLLSWLLMGPVAPQTDRFQIQFSAMVIGTVILSPHFYTYDLTVLLLPMALGMGSFSNRWHQVNIERCLAILIGLLFCLAGSFPRIASSIQFQPSLVFMIGWLIIILVGLGRASEKSQE